jgi:metal-responsive CopG/Arc/MetJ family transcriptional regulator
MKFAISVPDDVFQAVEAQAKRLGISRSQFFADAARAYVDNLTHWERVAEINAILEATGYDPAEDQAIANYGAAFLRATAHEWQEGDDDS